MNDLYEAAKHGDLQLVRQLIASGADVNYSEPPHNWTPLHSTTNAEIAEELIKAGANIEAKDKYGRTPLITACQVQPGEGDATQSVVNIDLITTFIKYKANVNAEDNKGNTALHYTFLPKVARILCQEGADVNKKNATGTTPIQNVWMEKHYRWEDEGKIKTSDEGVISWRFSELGEVHIEYGANDLFFRHWADIFSNPILRTAADVGDLLYQPSRDSIILASEDPSTGKLFCKNFSARISQEGLFQEAALSYIISQKFPFLQTVTEKVVEDGAWVLYHLKLLFNKLTKQDFPELTIAEKMFPYLHGANFKQEDSVEQVKFIEKMKKYQDDPSLLLPLILKIMDIVINELTEETRNGQTWDVDAKIRIMDNIKEFKNALMPDSRVFKYFGTKKQVKVLEEKMQEINILEAELVKYDKYSSLIEKAGQQNIGILKTSLTRDVSSENLPIKDTPAVKRSKLEKGNSR